AFPGVREAFAAARAPRRDTAFTYYVFSPSLPPRQGGPPTLDADRFAALRGDYPQATTDQPRDYSVLLSCGPFRVLEPGQSGDFAGAFIAGGNADSLINSAQSAQLAWRGTRFNLQPDRPGSQPYFVGETGINGHEICYEPPAGVEFNYDPHCPEKFVRDPAYQPLPTPNPPGSAIEVEYRPGKGCVWSGFDCDACTGFDGKETTFHWYVRAPPPPQPSFASIPRDRQRSLGC